MLAQLHNNNFNTINFRFRNASAWIDSNSPGEDPGIIDKILQFFSVKHILKKTRELNKDIQNSIEQLKGIDVNVESQRQFKKTHSSLLNLLDNISYIRNADVSKIRSSNILELHNELVSAINLLIEYELSIRLKFFPEKNKVILSYDEMKELRDCMKGWEAAEEQSDIYS